MRFRIKQLKFRKQRQFQFWKFQLRQFQRQHKLRSSSDLEQEVNKQLFQQDKLKAEHDNIRHAAKLYNIKRGCVLRIRTVTSKAKRSSRITADQDNRHDITERIHHIRRIPCIAVDTERRCDHRHHTAAGVCCERNWKAVEV